MTTGWLESIVSFQHKYCYIRDETDCNNYDYYNDYSDDYCNYYDFYY